MRYSSPRASRRRCRLGGTPVPLAIASGHLTGNLEVPPCEHALEVDVEDGLGGVRTLVAVLAAPGVDCPAFAWKSTDGSLDDGNEGDANGVGDDGTDEEDERGGLLGVIRRFIPAPGVAVILPAAGAAGLLTRRRESET